MRRIDELHLEHPFAGARMLRDVLKLEGHEIGRKHVGTLMKKLDIQAIYRKANTSRRARRTASIPTCCATSLSIVRIRSGAWIRPTCRCIGLRLSERGARLGHPSGAELAPVEQPDG